MQNTKMNEHKKKPTKQVTLTRAYRQKGDIQRASDDWKTKKVEWHKMNEQKGKLKQLALAIWNS
jgi:hypothetical protein